MFNSYNSIKEKFDLMGVKYLEVEVSEPNLAEVINVHLPEVLLVKPQSGSIQHVKDEYLLTSKFGISIVYSSNNIKNNENNSDSSDFYHSQLAQMQYANNLKLSSDLEHIFLYTKIGIIITNSNSEIIFVNNRY